MSSSGSLSALAIRRPVTVLMACAAVILLGVVSFGDLSVDLLPDIGTPRVTLVTTAEAQAFAPQEMERLITAPLENAVQTVSGVRRIASVSREGTSIITVEFPWGTDLDLASLHVREALDKVRQVLPQGVDRPAVLRWDPGSEPVMGLAVAGSGGLGALRDLVEAVVVPRMEQVDGIAGAQVSGGAQREIHVTLDPDKLTLYGLTVSDIEAALSAANSSLQSGNVLQGLLRYQVRAMGEFRTVDEIADVVVVRSQGAVENRVRLRDLGTVGEGLRPRLAGAMLNGRDAVGVLLYREAGSNTVESVAAAEEALGELRLQYPELTIEVAFENASFITDAIDSVVQNIALGSVLAFLVLFLFLRDPRNPVLIGIAVPISIVATFVLCYFAGISLNIMTLGGLALGAGLLVDNSIVVLENIFRHRQTGAPAARAAATGAQEVAMAVAAATFTTIAVFLPIAYVHGVAGELFAPQAWTVTFALVASLVVSLTVLPMLASRFLRLGAFDDPVAVEQEATDPDPHGGRLRALRRAASRTGARGFDLLLATLLIWVKLAGRALAWLLAPVVASFGRLYDAGERLYDRVLGWTLDHKALTGLGLLLLLAWGLVTALALPWELMPEVQTGRFEVVVDAPPGTPYAELERIVRALDTAARGGPEVTSTFATLGADPGALSATAAGAQSLAPTRARLNVALRAGSEASAQAAAAAIARVRAAAALLGDVTVVVDPQSNPMQRLLGLGEAGFEVAVRGDDLQELQRLAAEVSAALAPVEGFEDVKPAIERGNPEIRLRVRREAAAAYGASVDAIGAALQSALQGRVPTQFVEFDRRIDIRVLAISDQQSLEAVLDRAYATPRGPVPFRELVDFERATGPLEIRRRDRVREVPVRATLSGLSLSEAVDRVAPAMAGVQFPAGTYWAIGGEREEVEASFRSLGWALLLAAALVYMVMAAQFESLVHPFVIAFTLPLGWVGVVIALWLTGSTINVVALIGAVVLTGIIVNDGIVKIDTINRMHREGLPLREAVVKGSHLRLRPIMMTTVTTVSALIPLALGLGAGAELQRPLAIAIIGGEATGTLLTLVVLPVVYEVLARRSADQR